MTRSLCLALSGCLIAPCLALEVEELELNSQVTYRYGTAESMRIAGELELLPRLDLSLNAGWNAVLSMRLRADTNDQLMPGEPSLWSYSDASEPLALGDQAVLELRDAYLEWRAAKASIRLGRQQIVWGSLDGIKVLDVLNPQSFEHFILEDFDQSRIPLWAAYADFSVGGWRLETALIADDSTHYIPVDDAWMAFQSPRFRFGFEPGTDTGPGRERGAVGQRGGLAMRLSRPIGSADFELVAFSGRDHEPVAQLAYSGGSAAVEIINPRRDLLGFSLQQSIAQAVLRVEAGYSPERTLSALDRGTPQLRKHDNWRAAMGVDLNAPGGVFVNLQYLHDEVLDYSDALLRPRRERTVTLALRRGFAYETLQAGFQLYYGLEYEDRLSRFSLDYLLSDRISLGLAVEQFSGNRIGPFGQFSDRDQIALSVRFTL